MAKNPIEVAELAEKCRKLDNLLEIAIQGLASIAAQGVLLNSGTAMAKIARETLLRMVEVKQNDRRIRI